MKLYELSQGGKFTINGNKYVFNRIDGMYAKCEKIESGLPMLVLASLEVEVLDEA